MSDNEIKSSSMHHHHHHHHRQLQLQEEQLLTNEDNSYSQNQNKDSSASCLTAPLITDLNTTNNGIQLNQEQPLVPYDSSNEETPLLLNNSISTITTTTTTTKSSQSTCFTWYYIIIIITSIILIGLLWGGIIYNIVHNIESSINDSIQFNLDQVSIQLITSQGINIHILGSIDINYNDIINLIQRNSIKLITGIFGSLTIINLQPIEIYSKFIDLEENDNLSFIHLVDSYIPSTQPIDIKIGNLQTTDIDIISSCKFINNENFMKFLNDYYKLQNDDEDDDEDDKINLKIKGLVKQVKIKLWWVILYDVENIEFYKDVTIYKHDIIPTVNIDKFNLYSTIDNKGNDIINIKINALIEIPKFILSSIQNLKFKFGFINWNLFFNDCDGIDKLIKVGYWQSCPFQIVHQEGENLYQPILLTVIGNISSIPDELMNECPNNNDGKSPLNKILQKYLDNEPIEFYLQLLSSLDENDNGIPDWLFKFLHDTPIKLAITLPKMNIDQFDFHENLEIINHSSEVSIMNNDQFLVSHWNSNISTLITTIKPFKLVDLDINKFKFDFEISSIDNNVLVKVNSNDEYIYITMININQELINMVMNLPNLNISIIDAHQMGNIINKLLNRDYTDNDGEKEPDLFIEGNVYDVYGNLPIWKNNNNNNNKQRKLIDHLSIPLMKLPKLSPMESFPASTLDTLSNLTITITNLYLIESTIRKLELSIDLTIYNPTNFNINLDSSILIDSIIWQIFKNDSLISSIKVSIPDTKGGNGNENGNGNLFIPIQDYFNTTMKINIYSLNYRDKSILENSISSFISNDNLSNITIAPVIPIIHSNPLMELLLPIELTNITINSQILTNGIINFPEKLIQNIQIHLLTSQIQFEIYNPIINSSIILYIYTGLAKTNTTTDGSGDGDGDGDGDVIELGHLLHQERLIIPISQNGQNGIYKSPKLPIKINPMGMEILKKILYEKPDPDGKHFVKNVEINTVFNVKIDQFDVELYYNGNIDVKLAM